MCDRRGAQVVQGFEMFDLDAYAIIAWYVTQPTINDANQRGFVWWNYAHNRAKLMPRGWGMSIRVVQYIILLYRVYYIIYTSYGAIDHYWRTNICIHIMCTQYQYYNYLLQQYNNNNVILCTSRPPATVLATALVRAESPISKHEARKQKAK